MNFEALRERALAEWGDFVRPGRPGIMVGSGTCGRAAGALEVMSAFGQELSQRSLDVPVVEVGCLGMCFAEPLVEIKDARDRRVLYQRVTPKMVPRLIESLSESGEPVADRALAVMDDQALDGIPAFDELPMIKPQVRIAMRNCGHIDPTNLGHYIARGGYSSLARVLTMTPEEVIDVIEASVLRGRGGAGFPTGLKWRLCRRAPGDVKYLICNGDEGDPGAFMDRSLMEGDPHAIIEGMLIGAWAVGARQGALYVRGEYPLAIDRLNLALAQAREAGLLGHEVMGADFDFELRLVCNAGAFVSGEETALINSVQGSVAEPKPRPPFPADAGLHGRPTCINNVETWANVPLIIEKGADWFREIGAEGNGGTKLFSLSGKVKNTGLVEIPMGTTLRQVVYDIGGGILRDRTFKAVQTGGPAGGCIPGTMLDLPCTYEGLTGAGAIMGSGGMIVLDDQTCMVDMARYFIEFSTAESCGKCIPCREGTRHMLDILERLCRGAGQMEDLDLLERLARGVADASLCGLGQNAPNPVLSTLKYFRPEYEAHILQRKCPAGVCQAIIRYRIDPEACTGCGVCRLNCPVEAIAGEKKQVHTIDQAVCIKCGACREGCKFDAVIVE